ncbi:uncharacterized protein DFL_009401 [Arthrobotrys flagrans]|uniref:Uncharacterized protein n=1 Tax=Arthrobotrys flagrans TaxID=97331 RepID=A0A436ZRJ7_ARTFL|nr:hypothetical protein DFL_009401 [Arthrobotrys flagrans]
MTAYIIPPITLALLVRGAAGASDDDSASNWDDFANNFATDIAPIVVLFGEQVTKQFLSESTSTLDHIIFAVAPLGVLTAVVSVIRVCGNSSLKAFIGRAQEAHGISEAELCSSTSRDVCELWSNGGISRIFGRPKILEFIFSGSKDFYIKLPKKRQGAEQGGEQDDGTVKYPSCGIHKPEAFFCPGEFHDDGGPLKTGNWKEVKNTFSFSSPHSTTSTMEPDQRGAEHAFAPHPNLSLNVGIRPPPRWVQWAVAVFGILLQLSFFGYATWASYYASDIWEDGKPPQKWAFPLAAIGTGMLVVGMGLCAMLIDRRTHERRFEEVRSVGLSEKTPSPTPKATMFWLQPGNQSIGDQVFNSFAHWENKDKYITSWRVDGSNPFTTIFAIGPAITFSTFGFIFQFIGLRGLHGSVALYQLAVTLIMAFIRAALRSKRIDEGKNRLEGRREVEGHELDWIALQIERAAQEHGRHAPTAGTTSSSPRLTDTNPGCIWYIVDIKPTHDPQTPAAAAGTSVLNSTEPEVNIVTSRTKTWQDIVGFLPKPGNSHDEYSCARRAMEWIKFHEKDETNVQRPNKAARILHYRHRIARLTDSITPEQERPWNTQIRAIAGKLKQAIEATARHIFSDEMEVSDEWKAVEALVWPSTCRLDKEPNSDRFPIYFLLYRENGRWTISKHQLEAVLGLWEWSLKPQPDSKKFFDKILAVTKKAKKEKTKSILRLWISQTLLINDGEYPCPFIPTSEIQPILSVTASTFPQSESQPQVMLSTPSTASPLEMIAQDIYTMFINRVSNIMEPLKDIEPRTRKPQQGIIDLGISRDRPFLGLAEPNIEILVEKYIATGLGTREDALASIIPSLLHQQKLPVLEEVGRQIVRAAQLQRRSGDYQKCEDTLKGLLQLEDPTIEALAIRALGELYRSSIRSQKYQDREFGRRIGVELNNMSCLSPGAEEIQQQYKDVIQYLDNVHNKSPQTLHNIDIRGNKLWKRLEHDLDHREARPLDLLLTTKYDISGSSPYRLSRVIKWAIKNNSPELIEDLWKVAEFESTNLWRGHPVSSNGTPLFWAVENKCGPETFQSVIEWPGAKLEERAVNGRTALLEAAGRNLMTHVQALLKAGADVNARQSDGSNALHIATAAGHYEIAELLLNERIEIDAGILKGAASNGHYEVVELLLSKGASADNSLKEAASNGHYEVVELLLSKGVSADNGLKEAASNWHYEVVELLLSKGVSTDIGLTWAAYRGHYKVVELLLSKGVSADNGLEEAASNGHYEVVELLLSKGASADNGLEWAASNGHYKVVELLLSKGASADNGLEGAASNGHYEVVELLLSKGVSADNGLEGAAYRGHYEVVELLLSKGVSINIGLEWAAYRGHYGAVELLLSKGASADNGLEGAASNGHYEVVALLLSKGASADNGVKETASNGHYEVVELLLSRGADANNGVKEAASNGHYEVVELLLSRGADANNGFKEAASNGHYEVVELLLSKGASADNGLEGAASNGHYEVVELLLSKGASADNGLKWAASNGHYGAVELLLSKGASADNGLNWAASNGHYEVVELLLSKGASANNGLDGAASNGHYEVVELLLSKGASANNGLDGAASKGHYEVVALLLSKGASVDNGLQWAGYKGYYKVVELLLRSGASADDGLYWAVYSGHYEVVELLLSHGADANGGIIPAASAGRSDVLGLLLDKGADINTGGIGSALLAAVSGDSKSAVELLIERGADPNAQGGIYGNALNAAVYRGNSEIAEMLILKYGADINSQGGEYGNVLQSAAVGGNEQLIELLLAKNVDINAKGGKYGNALNAAAAKGHPEVVRVLLDNGANIVDESYPYDEEEVKADERQGYIHRRIIKLLRKPPCEKCQAVGLEDCDATLESCKLNWIHKAGLEASKPLPPSDPTTDG